MKRVVLSVFILMFLSIYTHYQITYAADTLEVSADNSKVNIIEDNRYLIPVNIHDNNGIMGFRIMLDYDSEKVRIISISRGLLTSEGNFAADISDLDGTADILWNHTADVKIKDGSLFFVTIEKLSDDLTMNISFSQPDTFNEKYKDVCFKCKKIEIKGNVQTKLEDAKLAELEEEIKEQGRNQSTNKMSSIDTEDKYNDIESDYSSHIDILSEEEAEENALKDYVRNKQKRIKNISESGDQLKNDDDTIKHPTMTEKEYDMHKDRYKDSSIIKNFTVVIVAITILIVVFICYKKYVAKNMEGKDEEKN